MYVDLGVVAQPVRRDTERAAKSGLSAVVKNRFMELLVNILVREDEVVKMLQRLSFSPARRG